MTASAKSSQKGRHGGQRGSALITALGVLTLTAVVVTGMLSHSMTGLRMAQRAFHLNAAMNIAESGLEEAMWSLNQTREGSETSWSGWGTEGSGAQRHFTGFALDGGTTGEVYVAVTNRAGTGAAPVIAARSIVTIPGQPSIEKWVEIVLRRRSRFANGLVARNSVLFRGNNASVDSWNSDPDQNPASAAVPYSAAVRSDRGSVASISISVNAVLLQNADVWGFASTGGSQPAVGTNGSILGSDSGTKDQSSWDPPTVDPSRVSTDFTANFDLVAAPDDKSPLTLGGIAAGLTLPDPSHTPHADGNYYYSANGVRLVNETLNITRGNVILIVPSGYDFSVGGGAGSVSIATGASLTLYAGGDVSIAGQGISNGEPGSNGVVDPAEAQQPIRFQLYGTAGDADEDTSTSHQTISIKGNGVLSGVVYAPNADIFINGNGDVLGSVVGNYVTMVGNAAFHYDESLGDMDGGSFAITRWNELDTNERSRYAGSLGP